MALPPASETVITLDVASWAIPSRLILMKITEALFAEHVVFHCFFDFIDKNCQTMTSIQELHTLGRLLDSILRSHSKIEDELLIEPLEHLLDQMGHQELFHDEHRKMESHLEALQAAPDIDEARRLLRAAVLLGREHFDKEERIVFPLAEQRLSFNTLTALGAMWEDTQRRGSGQNNLSKSALNRFVPDAAPPSVR